MSLFTTKDKDPDPIFKLPFIETSPRNKARFTTYKLPFNDKSLPTDKFELKDESPETNNLVPNETSDKTKRLFLKLVIPLTSNAYPAEMSLLIETNEEPDPMSTFPFIETSPVNIDRFTTYKLPFNDKSLPTDRFELKDESPETNNFVPNETSDKTKRLFLKLVIPLTSKAKADEMSLFTATDVEPEPSFTFPFIETSKVKTDRFTTYKLPFKDKSVLT